MTLIHQVFGGLRKIMWNDAAGKMEPNIYYSTNQQMILWRSSRRLPGSEHVSVSPAIPDYLMYKIEEALYKIPLCWAMKATCTRTGEHMAKTSIAYITLPTYWLSRWFRSAVTAATTSSACEATRMCFVKCWNCEPLGELAELRQRYCERLLHYMYQSFRQHRELI